MAGRAPEEGGSMLYRVIDASEIDALVRGFMEDYEVVAPVERDGAFVFDVISDPSEVRLDYGQTLSSPKKYLLPPRETLFTFDIAKNDVSAYEADIRPRVIFGAHSCDINAFNRLDLVFRDGPYPDPYYVARREKTLVVGMSCMPQQECFCNLMEAAEARYGYDLFLIDIGDVFIVSIGSREAAEVMERCCDVRYATDEQRVAFRETTRQRARGFNPDNPEVQSVAMLMDAFLYDDFWDEFSADCLSCTACSAVCPSCFCFDLFDEPHPDGQTGERLRVWDACTSPNFATVAGGHNFRGNTKLRVRHRMYHKLNGFQANYDRMLCVGCGRCVKACKANISPLAVLRFFKEKEAEHGDDER